MAAGRSTLLRRAGSFLALVAFEVGAVVLLTRLGHVSALRIPWHSLTPWLLNSPVEDVLAAILRMIALLIAWWLLASNALYLLASLLRVPGAIRAVRWCTLPVVRTVTDHAVALTLATSLMGGSAGATIAAATPAVAAAPHRSGPVAAGLGSPRALQHEQSESGYDLKPAGSPSAAQTDASTSSSSSGTSSSTTTSSTTTTTPDAVPTPGAATTTTEATTTGPTTTTTPEAVPTPGATTTTTGATSTTTGPTTTTRPPGATTPGTGQPPTSPQRPRPQAKSHRVLPGDNLWTISRDHLAQVTGRPASDLSEHEIAAYWLRVIAANRDFLDSGDPDIIFPGEVIQLPPVRG